MRWEYLRVDVDLTANEPILNKLGSDGWEMVAAIVPDGSRFIIYVFKRAMTDESKPAKRR